MNWNQPICGACYTEREPGRRPYVMREPERERCCLCGAETREGIYYRINPRTVPYPSPEAESGPCQKSD